ADHAHRASAASKGQRTNLKVRFYARMKPQRVYPLVVEVPGRSRTATPGGLGEAVTVRPLIPGAVVVPAEQTLDVSKPGNKATFQVTALARGRFPNSCVEVSQPGRPKQTIPIGVRGVTQRRTWVLLGLAVLIPALLFFITQNRLTGKYHPKTKVI